MKLCAPAKTLRHIMCGKSELNHWIAVSPSVIAFPVTCLSSSRLTALMDGDITIMAMIKLWANCHFDFAMMCCVCVMQCKMALT